jgi:glycosyltransferase involved in cell wall biosynthesis
MACGTPVISYNLGATSEIIQNNVNGFLIESPNDAINAIKNISKIKRINCRKHVEQNFSPIAAAKKHLEIYKRELNRVQTKNEYSHSRNANVSQSKLNF